MPSESGGETPQAPEMLAYYAAGLENNRLFQENGNLERERTQELLLRHLPPPPAVVLDVGGGPGVYARWLAERGYEVHLIDAVPLHVEQARQASSWGQPPASASVGDARQLDWDSESVDAVLLLGPLYHLTEAADRLLALEEARRVTRPGGFVFAVGISRFASLLDGLATGYLRDPAFARMVERDLADGQHRNPTGNPAYFTTAYFHHPDELRQEVERAGLTVVEMVSIEGPGAWARPFADWWDDPAGREQLLAAARAVEHEPTLIGLSPHLMVIARRPES
ncbi:MAG TPA: class I SAM-dependent methyltransferase [Thermomicrobiales bacterium]